MEGTEGTATGAGEERKEENRGKAEKIEEKMEEGKRKKSGDSKNKWSDWKEV